MDKKMTTISTEFDMRSRLRELEREEKREAEDRERAKKNSDFVQMPRNGMVQYEQLIARNPTAARILLLLANKMDQANAIACSYETLMELTNLGRTTIYRAVSHLKDENWLDTVKMGTNNVYMINSTIFWTSYGDRKHASFNATIVVSSSEQPKDYKPKTSLKRFPFLSIKKKEIALIGKEKLDPPDQQHLDLV